MYSSEFHLRYWKGASSTPNFNTHHTVPENRIPGNKAQRCPLPMKEAVVESYGQMRAANGELHARKMDHSGARPKRRTVPSGPRIGFRDRSGEERVSGFPRRLLITLHRWRFGLSTPPEDGLRGRTDGRPDGQFGRVVEPLRLIFLFPFFRVRWVRGLRAVERKGNAQGKTGYGSV